MFQNNVIAGASGQSTGFYPKVINGSLRFNDDDSAYLSWTPASAGNRKTWTWSGWVKRGEAGDGTGSNHHFFFSASTTQCDFYQNGFRFYSDGGTYIVVASQKLRDYSAWYHIVVSVDTTQATASDRFKIYINGEQVTDFASTVYPPLNHDTAVNSTTAHFIGKNAGTNYLHAYLANVHFIDGQALTASDFGETKNGVWVAKDYAGTFGTNGFYLTFEDDTQVEAFNTVLWRGNGGTQSVTGVGFKPDLVWTKSRSQAYWHTLYDSVRGAGNALFSNDPNQETPKTNEITAFDSDGFTFGNSVSFNESGQTYVAWCWKAGDSNVSNTDGTITSTVRANDTYGFSIVSYTGTGSNATVGHGLSSAPDFIIVKPRNAANNWVVYHQSIGATKYLLLNSTAAEDTASIVWNDTAPDTDKFYLGTNSNVNGSGVTEIAYCWSETTGYSKFGSYTGNGSTTGPTVTTGFAPAFLLIKRTDTTANWLIYDNTRQVTNPKDDVLFANLSNAEDGTSDDIEFTSTGFQLKENASSTNASGGTYIYAAFADTRESAFWLDQSGNDNDWQPVNLDHNDTVLDSPTNNFCTWNSAMQSTVVNGSVTLSDGNLVTQDAGTTYGLHAVGTITITSGQWYWEIEATDVNGYAQVGVFDVEKWPPNNSDCCLGYVQTGYSTDFNNSSAWGGTGNTAGAGATYTDGDIIGIALDMDNKDIHFYKNGTFQFTLSWTEDRTLAPAVGDGANATTAKFTANFGQQPFKYDPPA